MRICLIYDCLYPHTVGGAERWLRNVGERLAQAGHEVTYLTLRQWDHGVDPNVEGVNVAVVGPRMKLYGSTGKRRTLPPLVFGLGVFAHLARHGRRYDAVHTVSFPYFSLLAAALLRKRSRYTLSIDWFEVWTLNYWTNYLGKLGGRVGWLVQLACIRLRQHAFCFSRLHAERLRDSGLRGELTMLAGAYSGSREVSLSNPASHPTVVFAGRHIPEKRVPALVPAVAAARKAIPDLRARIIGDGPERARVLRTVAEAGLDDVLDVPGFIATADVDDALASATCMVLPSLREGYGLVVIESASHGTPSVVVDAADNAATELIEEGVNGYVASSAEARDLADAIIAVHSSGQKLRDATANWFANNAHRLSTDASLEIVVKSYG